MKSINQKEEVLRITTNDKVAKISTFSTIYESNDSKLAAFETKDGHIVCVETSKLA